MNIEFVNHASFILHHNDIRLIVDPWFQETAFDNGWSLISPSIFQIKDFENITHIWFSHEHPDHFCPPILKRIPADVKKKITVLYHETADKKVIDFCKKEGFGEVIELLPDIPLALDDELNLVSNEFTDGDSWAYFTDGKTGILNLNDCVVKEENDARLIQDKIGNVDVLFTQFSYAHKVGNNQDNHLRIAAIEEKKQRIRNQIEVFQPSFVVPFASFVFFCHEENKYMNLPDFCLNEIVEQIEESSISKAIVLYPGEEWDLESSKDNHHALAKYVSDYKQIVIFPFIKTNTINEVELIKNAFNFKNRLLSKNPTIKSLFKKLPVRFYVSDFGRTYTLDLLKGLIRTNMTETEADISITSDALNYLFKFEWGAGTCHVNARYITLPKGDPYRFHLLLTIGNLNNEGKVFVYNKPSLLKRFLRKFQSLNRKIDAEF
jgi:hypothetical protein